MHSYQIQWPSCRRIRNGFSSTVSPDANASRSCFSTRSRSSGWTTVNIDVAAVSSGAKPNSSRATPVWNVLRPWSSTSITALRLAPTITR